MAFIIFMDCMFQTFVAVLLFDLDSLPAFVTVHPFLASFQTRTIYHGRFPQSCFTLIRYRK